MRSLKFALLFLLITTVFTPVLVQAATLSLTPASNAVTVGQNFSVEIAVSTPDQAMNAVSGALSFPASVLEVTSVSKSGSVVGLWVQEPTFSNIAGTVNFEGVVLNPGFTGQRGVVLTVNFRAKQAGLAAVNFVNPSVLANDG